MLTFGIVCEFNPFHNGHKRLFDEARIRGAERIVCVMSGNAVQRGDLAICDKYARAEAAVRAGADLVLELPYPWSSCSAEHFARAAIYILSHFCDTIIFGSESGDIKMLTEAAEISASEEFKERYRTACERGEGSAFAFLKCLKEKEIETLSSNDLLGVEYIKAAKLARYALDFCTVERLGAAYRDSELGAESCPSASALRIAWERGEIDETAKYMPRAVFDVFKNATLTDKRKIGDAILLYLRLMRPDAVSNIADTEGGIANRMISIANESVTFEEFLNNLYTKRYTDAKLRRAVLFSLTDVSRELVSAMPEYTTLLGANKRGCELLATVRKNEAVLKIITKPADSPRKSHQFAANTRLEAVFTLASLSPMTSGTAMKKTAFIL